MCCALVFGLDTLIPAVPAPAFKLVTRSLASGIVVLPSAASSANSRSDRRSSGVIGIPVCRPPCSLAGDQVQQGKQLAKEY
eukprot:UN05438